ncbi:hypothetical protein LQT97_12885 [Brucella pseudogrignonensis]|uniref:hypothetical protein n=1 Tax=Brucella pseudogrignonensis TaxID=419475 RepID=UPI001E380660|nr:hypothetical protein [Brucella pseudogrignonensis]MCD4512124.1 hypothetical protein [Brucella pseudogrignonensis]
MTINTNDVAQLPCDDAEAVICVGIEAVSKRICSLSPERVLMVLLVWEYYSMNSDICGCVGIAISARLISDFGKVRHCSPNIPKRHRIVSAMSTPVQLFLMACLIGYLSCPPPKKASLLALPSQQLLTLCRQHLLRR